MGKKASTAPEFPNFKPKFKLLALQSSSRVSTSAQQNVLKLSRMKNTEPSQLYFYNYPEEWTLGTSRVEYSEYKKDAHLYETWILNYIKPARATGQPNMEPMELFRNVPTLIKWLLAATSSDESWD